MKIAILINNAFTYGGTENVASFMTQCFSETNSIDILSVQGSGKPFYNFSAAENIFSFKSNKLPLLKIIKKINKNNYDFVFVVGMGKLSFQFMLLLSFFRRKDSHKYIACEHVAIESFSKIIKTLKLWALKKYDMVIVLTNNDKHLLSNKGVRVKKIYNPLSFQNYQRISRSKSALAIGRLVPQKGFDQLLSIWSKFIISNPEWTLNIAGDGELKEDLIRLATKLNISSSVNFLGRVDNVDFLYRENDIFLMTSQYEGLPLVLLEAKSWSLPCIAFDCPTGPKEIINDDEDGYIVKLNDNDAFLDKLIYLANDFQEYNRISENCNFTHLEFSAEKIKVQWLSLLKKKMYE